MSLIDSLRKGLRYVLMSFGVSSQAKKPQTAPPPAHTKEPGQ
ncbi:MAG TPA: hypothetical protein VK720_03945 [Terracidiphilus sp.]|jgi:hypothetical protein|nr:hypothetical protein [Terracidiphilus sp.]